MRTEIVPPVDVGRIRRDGPGWSAARERMKVRPRGLNMSLYSAKKFHAWSLINYDKVLYADGTDVLFLRNASRMASEYSAFAAVRYLGSKRCPGSPFYMNAGVILLRPSLLARNVLYETYYRGNYTYCGGSGGYLDDQDAMTSVAAQPDSVLGPFHDWPKCFNYRGWPDQRSCLLLKDEIFLQHTPIPERTQKQLALTARNGRCRQPKHSSLHFCWKPPCASVFA